MKPKLEEYGVNLPEWQACHLSDQVKMIHNAYTVIKKELQKNNPKAFRSSAVKIQTSLQEIVDRVWSVYGSWTTVNKTS